jgi:hypothetical protein
MRRGLDLAYVGGLLSCAVAAGCGEEVRAPATTGSAVAAERGPWTAVFRGSEAAEIPAGALCDVPLFDRYRWMDVFVESLPGEGRDGFHKIVVDGTLENPANRRWLSYSVSGSVACEDLVEEIDEACNGYVSCRLVGTGVQLAVRLPRKGSQYLEAGRFSGQMTRFIESCEVVGGSFEPGPLAGRWDFFRHDLIALTCDHLGGG